MQYNFNKFFSESIENANLFLCKFIVTLQVFCLKFSLSLREKNKTKNILREKIKTKKDFKVESTLVALDFVLYGFNFIKI